MNKPVIMDDLLDLFDSNEISFEQLKGRMGNVPADELNEQIHIHLAAKRAIRKYGIIQQVASVHREYVRPIAQDEPVKSIAPVKNINSGKAVKWMMRIAASVTLLIGLYVAQYFVFYTPEKMYDNSFREYNLNTERGGEAESANEMVSAFREGNYKQVIGLYGNDLYNGNREKFLAGYAYLQENNFSAAENLFSQIIANNQKQGSAFYQDEAEYYLAMARLKLGNTEGALELMKKIHSSKEHTFHESVTDWMIFRTKWY